MTAAILAKASRQSTLLAAVAALHVGMFLVVAGDRIAVVLPPATGPIVDVLLPQPKPQPEPKPDIPLPGPFVSEPVEPPDLEFEVELDSTTAELSPAGPIEPTHPAGSGPRAEDYQAPSIAMRGDRLAALISGCYPPAARRLDEEGRALVRLVVSADGRAASWALAEGTGIPRLDSALDCVVRRLQFEPGRLDGRAVEAEVQLPIVFRLH